MERLLYTRSDVVWGEAILSREVLMAGTFARYQRGKVLGELVQIVS